MSRFFWLGDMDCNCPGPSRNFKPSPYLALIQQPHCIGKHPTDQHGFSGQNEYTEYVFISTGKFQNYTGDCWLCPRPKVVSRGRTEGHSIGIRVITAVMNLNIWHAPIQR